MDNMEPTDKISNEAQRGKRESGATSLLNTNSGILVEERQAFFTLNAHLTENTHLLEHLAHLNRERIPERMVHAKGGGAFGYFEVTHDITKYCKANLFSHIGKKTPIALRASTITREKGSADTVREPRGFSLKFYTEEGNWDLLCLNFPIFFLKDPVFFPSFIHSLKRDPSSDLHERTMLWDFASNRPETMHMFLMVFADRGIPDGYRHMHNFGIHTFEVVSELGQSYFVRFHFVSNQGIKNLTSSEAEQISGRDPDYANRDLYNAIKRGEFPSWTMCIQKMSEAALKRARFDPFDVTKVWPHKEYPLKPVGNLVLNRNAANAFAEIEQMAFSPSDLVPGIVGSPDKMFLARRFAYRDTQFYRLGTNHQQIPVNCPMRSVVTNYNRDGSMTVTDNQRDAPNYYPNTFGGPAPYVERYRTKNREYFAPEFADDYSQASIFYERVLGSDEKSRLVENLVLSISTAIIRVQDKMVDELTKVHPELGERVAEGLRRQNILNN